MVRALLMALLGVVHPLHTSAAEIELDARTREMVVTIRVYSDDLEAEMGRSPRQAAIAAWLRRGFTLRTAEGAVIELELATQRRVGALQHFTLRAGAGPRASLRGLRVHHTLFFGRFRDQLNLVRAGRPGRAITLLFSPGDVPATIR